MSGIKEENEYAKNIKDEVIYIGDAESGRKGYWCLGCKEEMDAVKRKNILHKSYFRHSAKGVDNDRKCTFSNQNYRHKLAIEILQFTKRIKVPNLYSFSPDGKKAVLLKEAEFIEANHVRAELTFYEDDEGNVHSGKNPDLENKNLLIRPDITFFNIQNEPILLVEIVVTHKLDDEKKVKLKRLGINTIQIVIPKDSEKNIVKSLQTTTNTKWVYNYDQERINYFQASKGNREELSSIDELQRKFFGESIACRTSQIKNLIRSIERSMGSEQYRRIEQQFESELSRVKANTKRNRERLDELERGFEDEVYSIFREQEAEVEEGLRDLEKQQIAFEKEYTDLEGRYTKKATELRKSEELLEREISEYISRGEIGERLREDFETRKERLKNDSERIKVEIERIIGEQEQLRNFTEQLEREEQKRFEQLKNYELESFGRIKTELESETDDIESKINNFGEFTEKEGRRVEIEFEKCRDESIKRINENNTSGNTELSVRIESILKIRGFLSDYDDRKKTYERYRTYLEFVRKGAWKEW